MNRWQLFALLAVFLFGCGTTATLPSRSDPGVKAEEERLADLIESAEGVSIPQPRRCSVRLLGQEGTTSYVWAQCEASGVTGESERPVGSLPLRVDDTRVSAPRDGGHYAEDVGRMFPGDLAEVILARDQRVFP